MSSRKVVLVTGAGKRRVGWHVAQAFAKRGDALAVHYNSSAHDAEETVAELRSRGLQAAAFQADLRDESQVKRLVDEVQQTFSRIDVLVNCAATWSPKPLEDTTADDVRSFFDANTLSTFLCCQHVGLLMTKQPDGGAIITIGDWATERPYLNYAAYFPSKGAIPTLTRMFAIELAQRNPNVRVNCILPGPVMLPPDLPAAERLEAISGTLVKREGSPEHVAQAVLQLVDNDFITGVCLPVDGGRTIA
jgi:pteridine reductase